MNDTVKKATRESYGEALASLGEKYDFLVLDADLAGATKTSTFKKAFPDRHIDCGIAESNMTGIAAGIAPTGTTVFISSFAVLTASSTMFLSSSLSLSPLSFTAFSAV